MIDLNGWCKSTYLKTFVGAMFGAAILLAGLSGCGGNGLPTRGGGAGPVDMGGEAPPEFGIQNFLSNSAFSDDIVLTVIYSVPDTAQTVVGFLQLLNAPANVGGTPIGAEEIVATNLPGGTDQSFQLDTTNLRPGFYQVGVRADLVTYLSTGTMEIQGQPSPLFLQPTTDITAESGELIDVVADIGDPQGIANWRLFYQDADAPLVEEGQAAGGQLLGVRIAEGSGNTVDLRWDTRGISSGSYRLGLSATDSGLTVAATVQAGRPELVVTTHSDVVVTLQPPPDAARPPTIEILTADVTAFGGDAVDIEFNAEVFEGDQYVVTFFYVFNDVETIFATVTDPAVSMVTFPTEGLPGGVYEVGARVFDGFNEVVETSTVQRLLVNVVQASDATLTVSQPGESVRVAQGDSVDIEWTTNVPPERGTIDVFARRFDVTDPLGDASTEIPILTGVSTSVNRATWTTVNERALYVVVVRLTITDPPVATPILATAPGTVRVSVTAAQFWLGQIGNGPASTRQGEVYQGVNFQDNAGTFVNATADYDGDGKDDFIIGARYAKPFFFNPSGIGIGESYFIFGDQRRNQTHRLNTAGTSLLRGVVLPGVRPRDDAQEETDGLGAVRPIPDQDGDGKPELMFGFPYIDSRGHTHPLVVRQQPEVESSLEKPRQFLRGGVVVVSSTTPTLSNPPPPGAPVADPDAPLSERAVVFLDLVGQNFRKAAVLENSREPVGTACGDPGFFFNLLDDDDPACDDNPSEDPQCFETFSGPWEGFNRDLADSFTAITTPFTVPQANTGVSCSCSVTRVQLPIDPIFRACPELMGRGGTFTSATDSEAPTNTIVGSGFYPLRFCTSELPMDGDNNFGVIQDNEPRPPFGARIIGKGAGTPGQESTTGDKFGASITFSGDFLLVSAPNRVPVVGEVEGPDASELQDNGLIYMFNMNNLWIDWRTAVNAQPGAMLGGFIFFPDEQFFVAADVETEQPTAPPMPYQYQIDTVDQCGRDARLLERFPSPFKVLGEIDQHVEIVEGVPDFNLDIRDDFAIGAPTANGGDGAVYIAYRRDPSIEGDYLLSKLSLDPLDVERLAGSRINGRPGNSEGFGEVIARSRAIVQPDGRLTNRTVDFNGDGMDDVIVGNPNADGGRGEIIVIFSTNDLITPAGGYDLDTLLTLSDADGNPRAVRITGRAAGDQFGFNVAVVGDFNGDGVRDLLVAAPGASPMFDSDDDGTLDSPGVDVINLGDPGSPFGDGAPDVIPGATDNFLTDAGEVYLILGASGTSNNLATLADATRSIDISTLGTSTFRGVVFIGREQFDALGGGVEVKRGKRSFGIGPAGDVDGDGRDDILIGSILADPDGRTDAGEAYLIYGFGL